MQDPEQRSAIGYLEIMERSATDALLMVEGMDEAAFADSKVTFHAVAFCHFLAGQAAADLIERYPEFATDHPQIPWTATRAMRDHILGEFSKLRHEEIWLATQDSMRSLAGQIAELRNWHAQGE
jgi:uncharacterized protein with HEPN domain